MEALDKKYPEYAAQQRVSDKLHLEKLWTGSSTEYRQFSPVK